MHSSISDYISDIVQNSIEANSNVVIIDFFEDPKEIHIFISDDGKGMNEETLQKALDPFYSDGKHENRKAGLGLPFLKQGVETAEGVFLIKSEEGLGTAIEIIFKRENVDTPPHGALAATFTALMSFPGNCEISLNRAISSAPIQDWKKITQIETAKYYSVSKSELIHSLDPIESTASLSLLKQFFETNEESLL